MEKILNLEGNMRRRAIMLILLVLALATSGAESRSTSVDFILLMDTSLSMADAIGDARQYAAGEIVGRLVEPGDWVTLIGFYGQSEIVWQGDIQGQAEISALVRSLNNLEAKGRYTDIGAALDFMDKLINQRGFPERPKYILLLTDERQEAPKGSAYYSTDYSIEHPLLEYVKRVDMGSFRVITVGYGLAAQVEGQAHSLMTTLSDPPARPSSPLPGQSTLKETGNSDSAASIPSDTTSGTQTGQSEATDGNGSAVQTTKSSEGEFSAFTGVIIAAGLAAAGAAGIFIAVLRARRKKRDDNEKAKVASPERRA